MSVAFDSSEWRHLQALWAEWTAMVSQAALPRWRRRHIHDEQFARMRQRLLRVCAELAHSTADRRRRSVVLRMHELVQPWTSPKSIVSVEQKYLASLILECRALGRELRGWQRSRWLVPSSVLTSLLIAAIAASIWWTGAHAEVWDQLVDAGRQAARWLQSTNFLQRFAAATLAMIAAGILLLNRTRVF